MCKYCKCKIKKGQLGYLNVLDNQEKERMNQLKLNQGEKICIECKKTLLFSSLIPLF